MSSRFKYEWMITHRMDLPDLDAKLQNDLGYTLHLEKEGPLLLEKMLMPDRPIRLKLSEGRISIYIFLEKGQGTTETVFEYIFLAGCEVGLLKAYLSQIPYDEDKLISRLPPHPKANPNS